MRARINVDFNLPSNTNYLNSRFHRNLCLITLSIFEFRRGVMANLQTFQVQTLTLSKRCGKQKFHEFWQKTREARAKSMPVKT